MKENSQIHYHCDNWELKCFGNLNTGDLFILQSLLLELIDRELAKEPHLRRSPEEIIATEIHRRIPPISFDDQVSWKSVPASRQCYF